MSLGVVEWLVVDMAHAFHNIPTGPSERLFRCGKVGTRFLVFKFLNMGRKSPPNKMGQGCGRHWKRGFIGLQ